jgi:AcrR family transcriptional regulator
MKRLKQIEEYKKMIGDALIVLLQSYTMDQITVTQIANKAGIGRNTFYNHFEKKEDVLDFLLEKYFNELQNDLLKKSNPSIRDFLLWRFTLLRENPLLSIINSKDEIRRLLYHYRNNKISRFDLFIHEEPYKMEFFQGGIDYVTSTWIMNGRKETPEEMADKVLLFMNR